MGALWSAKQRCFVNIYSTFAGKLGAADQQLASEGRLKLVRSPDEFSHMVLTKRENSSRFRPSGQGKTREIITDRLFILHRIMFPRLLFPLRFDGSGAEKSNGNHL